MAEKGKLKFKPIPMLLEFLLPISVQIIAIAVLLSLAKDSPLHTMLGLVVSLIWLKVTHNQTVQEAGEIRAGRRLFSTIGKWNNQSDAERLFDEVMADCLMIDPIEHEDTWALVTAWGMANTVRGALAVVLQLYLLLTVALVAIRALGT